MSDAEPLFDWPQNWDAQQCDGGRENEWRVKIATLGNPV
ncbi:immunity 53 family protein [Streptomyces sp. NBC_01727]|nr:immunity 53 family protein [Streptomyces sp. NBC_01727]